MTRVVMEHVLSIDVGTTSVKGVLFDALGKACAVDLAEYELVKPSSDIVELDPEVYWRAAKKIIKNLLAQSKVDAKDIISVGVTSQGETLIVLDKNGEPLRPAIVWADNRSQQESQEIGKQFGLDEIFRITGQQEMAPTFPATKILWLRRNEPSVFAKIHKFLMVEDYILFKLTGQYFSDCSLNPSTVYFDLLNNRWWPAMLKFLGISEGQLPELKFAGEFRCPISPGLAKETGLSGDTTVTSAPIDQIAGAIGAGNLEPGTITETTGAALAICATVDQPTYDPQKRIPCFTHGIREKYVLLPWVPTAGLAFQWFRRELAGSKDYSCLCDEAESIAPGADGLFFLPYLCGAGCPENVPAAKGVFWGITLAHRQAHFTRAVLESVSFVLKRNIKLLENIGVEVKEIRSLGGGAKSELWLQIKADMIDKPIVTMESEESTSRGVAMLSFVANGVYKNLVEAKDNMVHVKKRIEPDPENMKRYNQIYSQYLALHNNTKALFAQNCSATDQA